MDHSNQEVANLLRSVATALTLKKASIFQIRAYGTAADAIEHSTAAIKDIWEEGRLGDIPGVGENLEKYLDEYFKTGKVGHFDSLMKDIPDVVFQLIDVPGVGPKTAMELAKLGVKDLDDLQAKIKSGELVNQGFSAKIAEKLILGIKEREGLRTGRMLLPFAYEQAEKIVEYLKRCPDIEDAHPLGSLRRQVATVGDLDFSASTKQPEKAIAWFLKMPGVKEVVSNGENKAMVVLSSGVHVDLLVGHPETYGALLQHFTGSKHHNIKLRTFAEKKGLSLSEYGVKRVQSGRGEAVREEVVATKTEDAFYKLLGMDTPIPEIREDAGEIEAALSHSLPQPLELSQIKGDLHLHSNFPMEPSHGPGANSLEEIIKKALELGYEFVGISDHSPGFTTHKHEQILELIYARNKAIEQLKYSHKNKIRVLNGLEIDILPNGTLSVPNEGLETLDYCIAGVHSSHKMGKEEMTKRILTALSNPFVNILSHPTGRLLNERESYEADWEQIFKFAAANNKILEINAFPNRLDLRDDLIKRAKQFAVKFIIDTDAHKIDQMDNMQYGVSLAKRGWAEPEDVVNTWEWKKFSDWFNINM